MIPTSSEIFVNENAPETLVVVAISDPSSYSLTVDPFSAVPSSVKGVVLVVVGFENTGAAGAVVSRVMTTAVDAGDLLVAASVALAVKELAPSASATLKMRMLPNCWQLLYPQKFHP